MMPRSVPQTGQPKRRFSWPKGMPQIIALILVLVVDSFVAPHFFQIVLQDGRLFGSPIDILNRAAPVALLAIGMTLVIATGGIDLSVGAVMAIAGATAASMTVAGHSLPVVLLASLAAGRWRLMERYSGRDPEDPAFRGHADSDGCRARRRAADYLRADRDLRFTAPGLARERFAAAVADAGPDRGRDAAAVLAVHP